VTEDPNSGDRSDEPSEALRNFIQAGGQVVGQVAGAAVALFAGPFVGAGAGAAIGEVLARVGTELHDRVLGPRQNARAAGALASAAVRIEEHLAAGDVPRTDGFFDAGPDGRPEAEEVLEGTLLTASNAWEERKVEPLGRLYANLAFDPSISAARANFLLRIAERLTYQQLAIMALIAEAQSGPFESAFVELETIPSEPRPTPRPEILTQLADLSDARLLGYRNNTGAVGSSYAMVESGGTWRPNMLIRADLTEDGYVLHRLMELDRLARSDVEDILVGLGGRLREVSD
jgi:hypothetical protein